MTCELKLAPALAPVAFGLNPLVNNHWSHCTLSEKYTFIKQNTRKVNQALFMQASSVSTVCPNNRHQCFGCWWEIPRFRPINAYKAQKIYVGTAGKDLQLVILSHHGMSYLKGDERRLCYSDLVRRAKRLELRLNKVVVITTPTLLRLDN